MKLSDMFPPCPICKDMLCVCQPVDAITERLQEAERFLDAIGCYWIER